MRLCVVTLGQLHRDRPSPGAGSRVKGKQTSQSCVYAREGSQGAQGTGSMGRISPGSGKVAASSSLGTAIEVVSRVEAPDTNAGSTEWASQRPARHSHRH